MEWVPDNNSNIPSGHPLHSIRKRSEVNIANILKSIPIDAMDRIQQFIEKENIVGQDALFEAGKETYVKAKRKTGKKASKKAGKKEGKKEGNKEGNKEDEKSAIVTGTKDNSKSSNETGKMVSNTGKKDN